MGNKQQPPKGTDGNRTWINDLEIEDAQIKWAWSHFNGAADTFNAEGDRNFVVSLNPDDARALMEIPDGWSIKEYVDTREGAEGSEPEYTIKVKISYRFEPPKIFFLKEKEVELEDGTVTTQLRKFRVENETELNDITRATVKRIDFVAKPSRWMRNGEAGVTPYLSEMYVHMQDSKIGSQYDDIEEL
jgi:hypothetical protein